MAEIQTPQEALAEYYRNISSKECEKWDKMFSNICKFIETDTELHRYLLNEIVKNGPKWISLFTISNNVCVSDDSIIQTKLDDILSEIEWDVVLNQFFVTNATTQYKIESGPFAGYQIVVRCISKIARVLSIEIGESNILFTFLPAHLAMNFTKYIMGK